MSTTKRKRTQIPALLRAATLPMPFHHYCETCRVEIGRTSHPTIPGSPPIYCAACKRAMREVAAA